MLLCRFTLERNKETYEVYGDVSYEEGKTLFDGNYIYPEFENLTAKKQEGERLVDFQPTGTTWAGRRYEVEDMISNVVSYMIMGCPGCEVLFMEESLSKLISEYRKDVEASIPERNIPKKVLYTDLNRLYLLTMVTDKYIYYCCIDDEVTLMLSADDFSVISDNYFAEMGFYDSLEAIDLGEETLLYRDLPEED